MSRSIGDSLAEEVGVINETEIEEHNMRKCDSFIVLGSDGIFDVLSN